MMSCGSSSESNAPTISATSYQVSITFKQSNNSSGIVNIAPGGASCTDSCLSDIIENTTVEITAAAQEGSVFISWDGDCSGTGVCKLLMNKNKSITALFEKTPIELVTLSAEVSEGGSIASQNNVFTCTSSCAIELPKNEAIILTPTPEDGYDFIGWGGACTGSSLCSISMSNNLVVTALFELSTSPLASNTLLITEPHGIDHTYYPIQIGRPFLEGEITDFPQVMQSGVEIPTQVDIKQRHPDGSVKHAIISFILASLPANSSKTFTFANKTTSDNTPLTQNDMLSYDNFNAHMVFKSPEKESVTAKEMLANGDFTYWLKGPIATSVILADHSFARRYDVGSDENKSIRPTFHVTFWPTINKYSIRFVSEVTNTETLQDQRYDIELLMGTADEIIYQNKDIPHQNRSRWTKKFWSGLPLKTLSIDHNINYLSKTKALPNFDTSRMPSEASINAYWNTWLTKDNDIYQPGLWQRRMSTAGGRPDIGLYPTWTVKWLYTGDWRHQEIALQQSELAASWPIHLREGDSDRKFDFAGTIEAIGKIISMAPQARPTHWTDRPDWHEINPDDKITFVGEHEITEWRPDTAHHPDLASPQYLLTGEYFYLEEMLFSAAFVSGDNNAKGFKSSLGRGPTGSEGGLYSGETRGQAWALRTRVHTHSIIPDSFPEKSYFHHINNNAITMFEGLFELDLTNTDHQELYDFVKVNITPQEFKKTKTPSTIGQWDEGVSAASYVRSSDMDTTKVNQAIAPWMQNFVIIALGRAKELGYNTETLLNFAGKQLLQPFKNPDLPHTMICVLAMPTLDNNNQWFTSWEDIYTTFTPEYIETITNFVITNRDAEHGYPSIAMAAAAYLKGQPQHLELWSFIKENIATKDIFNDNPKWAILPRED